LFAPAGCQPAGGVHDRVDVQIAVTKADLFGIPPEFRALHVALEKVLDCPVAFPAQASGEHIGSQLEHGHVEYAILSASEYAAMPNAEKVTPLATAVNPLGKTTRKGVMVIKAKSHLKTISDCAGKRFAFGTHKDLLTDYAARRALEDAGVPLSKLLPELLPPPFAMEGRLYVQDEVPSKIVLDLTVNAGVVDEVVFAKLPETGGNPITGPSKDQFEIVGYTMEVPELVVVAGPAADPAITSKLKDFLLNRVKDDAMICQQLGIKGFSEPVPGAYEAIRAFAPKS
jgi:ABC-type phosphate/phosphonate transport system substrate-binding protein